MKAAVFDEKGQRLGIRAIDYTLDTDSVSGYIEFNPDSYIEMCKRAIDELTEECGNIDALSVDTQGETLILTDENGTPTRPAIIWLDNRAVAEAEEIKAHFGSRAVYEVTGQTEICAAWPAPKLLWIKRNQPEVFEKTKKIFLLEDWVLYKLSGEFVTEPTIQSSSIYFNIKNSSWWTEMLDYIGVSTEMLPRITPSATPVGEYKGIKVVSGLLDQIAGTIGAGATNSSIISEMTGTIMVICVPTDKMPPYREDNIIPCHAHALPGMYCLLLCSSTAGMALKWFKNELAETYSFKELDKLAEKVNPGCDGLTMLPYLCGASSPKYNPNVRAVFAGIDLSHTRAHFARAIMESIAFNLKDNLEYIGSGDIKEIRITGGGAASPLWAQIKSDVTGKTLSTLTEGETACLGTALAAAVGIGDFASIQEAADSIVRTGKTYSPSGADYTAHFERYKNLDNLHC